MSIKEIAKQVLQRYQQEIRIATEPKKYQDTHLPTEPRYKKETDVPAKPKQTLDLQRQPLFPEMVEILHPDEVVEKNKKSSSPKKSASKKRGGRPHP